MDTAPPPAESHDPFDAPMPQRFQRTAAGAASKNPAPNRADAPDPSAAAARPEVDGLDPIDPPTLASEARAEADRSHAAPTPASLQPAEAPPQAITVQAGPPASDDTGEQVRDERLTFAIGLGLASAVFALVLLLVTGAVP